MITADYPKTMLALLFDRDSAGAVVSLGGAPSRWQTIRRVARARFRELLDNAFPQLSWCYGAEAWALVVESYLEARGRASFEGLPGSSPFLRDVPQEFLRWFESTQSHVPGWFVEIARYEQILLEVAHEEPRERPDTATTVLSLALPPSFSGPYRVLRLGWPVHRFADDEVRPRPTPDASPVQLCVYRHPTRHVAEVFELSPFAAIFLEEAPVRGRSLVETARVAAAREGLVIDAPLVAVVSELISELHERGILVGSVSLDLPSLSGESR